MNMKKTKPAISLKQQILLQAWIDRNLDEKPNVYTHLEELYSHYQGFVNNLLENDESLDIEIIPKRVFSNCLLNELQANESKKMTTIVKKRASFGIIFMNIALEDQKWNNILNQKIEQLQETHKKELVQV